MGKITGSIDCSPKSTLKADRKISFWEQSQRNDVAEVDGSVLFKRDEKQHSASANPCPTGGGVLIFIPPFLILWLMGNENHKDSAEMALWWTLSDLWENHRSGGNWPRNSYAKLAKRLGAVPRKIWCQEIADLEITTLLKPGEKLQSSIKEWIRKVKILQAYIPRTILKKRAFWIISQNEYLVILIMFWLSRWILFSSEDKAKPIVV